MSNNYYTQYEDTPLDDDQPICKFFARGNCRYGSNCFYSHNLPPQHNDTSREQICKFFLSGTCRFGDGCFYLHPVAQHVEPKQDDIAASLVNRVQKLKLVEKNLTEEEEEVPQHLTHEEAQIQTPASYYEALTGNKLNLNQNLNTLDLSMFDETYINYLKLEQKNQVEQTLCPYFEKQFECPFTSCAYIHGDVCDICQTACLNPFDSNQCEQHRAECMKQMEKEMEEAFAVQRSNEKPCGICMEVVWQKEKVSDRRFGILENCNHCFCLVCIRQWRASKSYENKIVKACPECRVKSDYVTPSSYWFDNEEEKKTIINDYKSHLGKTECKYFKRDSTCPFGSKCFYLHRNKDGSIAQLPDPGKRRRFNRFGDSELYSNLINIDLDYEDYSDYEDDDIYDTDDDDDEHDLNVWMMLRNNFFSSDVDDSDFMDEFLNMFE